MTVLYEKKSPQEVMTERSGGTLKTVTEGLCFNKYMDHTFDTPNFCIYETNARARANPYMIIIERQTAKFPKTTMLIFVRFLNPLSLHKRNLSVYTLYNSLAECVLHYES